MDLAWVEVAIAVAIYMAILVAIGLAGARKAKTMADFIAASGSLGFLTYVLLMAGSIMSGMTALGVAGVGYVAGYATWWEQLAVPSAMVISTILFGAKLNKLAREKGYLTVQDYLAERFDGSKAIRGLSGLVSAFVCVIYLVGQYIAIGIVMKVALGLEYWQGCLVAMAITVIYVMAGGLLAVAWTTLVQGVILIVGMLATAAILVGHVGGWEAMNLKLAQITAGPFADCLTKPFGAWDAPLVSPMFALTLFGLTVLLGLSVAPHIVNNTMAFRDPRCLRWGPLAMFAAGFAVLASVKLIGIAGRVAEWEGLLELPKHPVIAGSKWTDMILPVFAKQVLHPMVFAILAVAILAAVMSTTDRLMLTVASNVGYDIYRNLIKPTASDAAVKALGRAVVAVVGVATYLIALSPPPLMAWLIWTALGIMLSTWFPALVAALYWKRATRQGCLAGMVVGFASTLAVGFIAAKPPLGLGVKLAIAGGPIYFPVVSLALSIVALVAVSLMTAPKVREAQ